MPVVFSVEKSLPRVESSVHVFFPFSASIVQSKAGIAVAAFVCDADSRNEVKDIKFHNLMKLIRPKR